MKIKIALLDIDELYLKRVVSSLYSKYSDKIEIYSFSSLESAIENIIVNRINIFISSDNFNVDTTVLPKSCGFAYFVESHEIEKIRDQRTICKFQKIDTIYKEILTLFSENVNDSTTIKVENSNQATVILFSSPVGGVGNTTLAAVYAKHLAMHGKKVLFLNFEKFNTTNIFFQGDGQYSFSDVIYLLKQKKQNISLKLESYMKTDSSGVSFFSSPDTVMDMLEVDDEDIKSLIDTVLMYLDFNYIIIDQPFSLDKRFIDLCINSSRIVSISDGSEVANNKIIQAYNALEIIEKQKDIVFLQKFLLMYNKFNDMSGQMISNSNIQIIGGIPVIAHSNSVQIINRVVNMNVFENIVR